MLYAHGLWCIFGGCSREHPYTLDNQCISPVGLLHGAAAEIEGLNLSVDLIEILKHTDSLTRFALFLRIFEDFHGSFS